MATFLLVNHHKILIFMGSSLVKQTASAARVTLQTYFQVDIVPVHQQYVSVFTDYTDNTDYKSGPGLFYTYFFG